VFASVCSWPCDTPLIVSAEPKDSLAAKKGSEKRERS
jgi:hypothetical protein